MQKINNLYIQLEPMKSMIQQLKKDKDSALKKVEKLQKEMSEAMKKLQVSLSCHFNPSHGSRRGAISTESTPASVSSVVHSRAGGLRLVHSFMSSNQFFFWWPCLLLLSRVPCRMVFEMCGETWPSQESLHNLTADNIS